jgi:hypothetical protein
MPNEPTIDELRRVGHWLASIGYYSAAGQCHRRAWQREQAEADRCFGQPHHGHELERDHGDR